MGKVESRSLDPTPAELNQSLTLFKSGRYAEAESRTRMLIERYPDYGFAWKLLGACLQEQGKDTLSVLQKTAGLMPGNAEAHNNLGNALQIHGQHEKAAASCRRALELKPDFAEAHSNLGNALQDLGQLDDAAASYRRALELKPDFAVAHYNLGSVQTEMGQLDDAVASFRRALKIDPGSAIMHHNLGAVLQDMGQLDSATDCYRRALELAPHFTDTYSNLLFAINYSGSHTPSYCLEEARNYGRVVAAKAASRFTAWQCAPEPARLRVGILSSDLRNHAVGYFLESFLAQIDTARVELIAYPTFNQVDDLTARIKPCFSAWKPVFGLSDEAAARLIHADGVHVLLDLAGHTAHNRLPIFAWKPAPVQATWLGYFATTGVAEMDYLLADEASVPESQRGHFTETVWYLPDTKQCLTQPKADLPIAPLPALKNGYVTFGCFQRLTKVGDAGLMAWAEILNGLPDSRLRLAGKELEDPAVVEQFVERLKRCGIDPERVLLHGAAASWETYMTRYGEVDVLLDTFPYTGTTTTSEALWMGVPTLTLAGDTFLARFGTSVLVAAGLQECVATSVADYIARAISLAGDLPRLSALRVGLREQVRTSPLFDARRFAGNFESALWGMWQAHARRVSRTPAEIIAASPD